MDQDLRAAIAGLIVSETSELTWNGPFGPVAMTVTDTRTFFNRHPVIDIAVPPGTPFPLETHSYVATGAEVERAGGAKGFVSSLIAVAERTAAWRAYVERSKKRYCAGGGQPEGATRPRPGRRRLKLGTPTR